MPDVNKFFGKGFNVNFNLLLFFLIAMTFIGNYWMVVNGIEVGRIYFFMMLATIAFIFLGIIFTKGTSLEGLSKFIRIPFSMSLGLASLLYVMGWGAAILLETILSLISTALGTSYSITSFSIPLFSVGKTQLAQSFSAAEFSASMPWKLFNVSFNAGATEEFVFTFGLMIVGVLIGLFLLRLIFQGKAPFGMKDTTFVTWVAIIFSTILFMAAHQLNSTYVLIMFIIAAIFKLVSLISVYFFSVFLVFWIGYHQANNFIFLVQTDGASAVANGMVSGFGAFFILFFLALFWFIIVNFDKISKEFGRYIRS